MIKTTITMVEKLDNGYLLNGSVKVFNIEYEKEETPIYPDDMDEQAREAAEASRLSKARDAIYDIEYNELKMHINEAISIAETFFKDVIVTYLAGKFVQKPASVISKKLRTPQ